VNLRWNTVRSRNVELRDSDSGVELRVEGSEGVEGLEIAGGVAGGVVIRSVSRLPIRLPMLLDRSGLKVPDGLDAEGARSKTELRVRVSVVRPDQGVAGTLGDADGV
jgi:hypothetical protein